MDHVHHNAGAIVTLNIGGQIFKTTFSTLVIRSGYFRGIFDPTHHPIPNQISNNSKDRELFIDRSPHIFKHVLAFLRDIEYHYPRKYVRELDFYQIDYEDFPDQTLVIINRLNKIEKHLYETKRDSSQDRLTLQLGPARVSPFSSPQQSPMNAPSMPSYAAVANSNLRRHSPQTSPPQPNYAHGHAAVNNGVNGLNGVNGQTHGQSQIPNQVAHQTINSSPPKIPNTTLDESIK